MLIVPGHQALPRPLRAPAVAIGNFDGVHRGHQRLFEEIRGRAAARQAEAVVLTFEPHPAKVLAPRFAPPLICTPARKLERIAAAGLDACVVEPFDAALAALSPTEFVDQVIVRALGAHELCIGYNFTFGKGRAGDAKQLAALGRSRGFDTVIVEPVTIDGIVCSSTKVREFVLAGRIDGATLLLGRAPEIEGMVIRGAGRGRTLGIPTANLRPETELLPAPGVYAGWAELPTGKRHRAAINLGTNPTFQPTGALHVEAHLIGFSGELYDSRLRLGLLRRLRPEQRFSSAEALIAQIKNDIAEASA